MSGMDRLVVTGFSNTDMRGLAYTMDGNTLTPLPGHRPYAHPAGTWGTRDPSLNRVGGRYVMASTRAALANYLGPNDSVSIAAADTLVSWRWVRDVPSGVPGTTRCWAPEWLVDDDGSVYLYYAVSTEADPWNDTVIGFNIYARQMDPVTLAPLTPPVKMDGLTGDITPRVIDAQVTHIGDRYCMFVKDERAKRICRAWADGPLGPWTYDQSGDWLGTGQPTEGPELVPMPGGWRLYFDLYTAPNGGQLAYKESVDLDTWGPTVPLSYTVRDLRHPGYLWLTAGEWVAFRSMPRRVTVWSGGAQPAANATIKVLAFAGSVDDAQMWSPDRPTMLVAADPGTYTLNVEVAWKPSAAGRRFLLYRVSGGPWRWFASQPANASGGTEQAPTVGGVTVDAGATFEVGVYQDSGAALDVVSTAATLVRGHP